jgi:putative SOS response-associated peptidase YedK
VRWKLSRTVLRGGTGGNTGPLLDKTVAKKKLPVWFHLKDNAPFAFAGIWDVWPGPQGKVFTVAILTTTPNDLTKEGHDRMPVLLRPEAEAAWLDPNVDDPDKLMPLVGPYPAELMAAAPANPALNKPSFEGPDCLVPPDAGRSPHGSPWRVEAE